MNKEHPIDLVVSLSINTKDETRYKALAQEVFPSIMTKTGWQLTTLWPVEPSETETIAFHNLWQTNALSKDQAETALTQAINDLCQQAAGFAENLEQIDLTIVEEELQYVQRYHY
ncbi:hypothetical protein [Photobacterium sp. TY1-4]|uniref:hypothetical protein n=1 Tax=Photobacterium sp. TY1-4 TaxID=2899122 RepID=UPI0021C14FC2|nr:hypothetical protein [Photobacterium sp. TY1-4]UXI02442.1 hypothetical protein NH461_06640 [Photobacterium sp. TY1-4]